jgi:hypothetical protein
MGWLYYVFVTLKIFFSIEIEISAIVIYLVFDKKKSKLFPSKFNTKPLRKSFQISNQGNKIPPLPESQPLNRNLERGTLWSTQGLTT